MVHTPFWYSEYLWAQYIHCRCSARAIRNRWKPHYSGIKQDKGRLKSRRGGGTGTAFNKLIAPLFSYLLTASIHGAINGSAWPINFALLFAYTAQRRFKCSAAAQELLPAES
jgi:hypothetical protein